MCKLPQRMQYSGRARYCTASCAVVVRFLIAAVGREAARSETCFEDQVMEHCEGPQGHSPEPPAYTRRSAGASIFSAVFLLPRVCVCASTRPRPFLDRATAAFPVSSGGKVVESHACKSRWSQLSRLLSCSCLRDALLLMVSHNACSFRSRGCTCFLSVSLDDSDNDKTTVQNP